MSGHGGYARIGNRRRNCATCNNFAANVNRIAAKRLRERFAEEYQQMLIATASDLYPQVIEEFHEQYLSTGE